MTRTNEYIDERSPFYTIKVKSVETLRLCVYRRGRKGSPLLKLGWIMYYIRDDIYEAAVEMFVGDIEKCL